MFSEELVVEESWERRMQELEIEKRELKEMCLMREEKWTQKEKNVLTMQKYQLQLHCFNWSCCIFGI